MKQKKDQSTVIILASIVFLLVALYIVQQFDVTRKFECQNSICSLEEQRFIGIFKTFESYPVKSIVKVYNREHALEQAYIYRLYISTHVNSVIGIEIASNENPEIIENFKKDLEKYILDSTPEIKFNSAANKNNRYMGIGLLVFAALLLAFGIKEKIKSN